MIGEAIDERINRVVEFKVTGDCQIEFLFDDDTDKSIDFEPVLSGPLFGPLRDPAAFAAVRLIPEFGAIEWPNGADIDPTVLRNWEDHLPAILARRQHKPLSPD